MCTSRCPEQGSSSMLDNNVLEDFFEEVRRPWTVIESKIFTITCTHHINFIVMVLEDFFEKFGKLWTVIEYKRFTCYMHSLLTVLENLPTF
ncbi:3100_t:CDS:2 [Gigaspora rosea]|nr:3100_t:CDS:2 [Gigaspora rosea]